MCGFCRGWCCRHGGQRHAFIDLTLLKRRQARHGGSIADAAAHYLAAVPKRHVQQSCLYATAEGCVLPRDERAPTCNSYACSGLVEARQQMAQTPADGALLATEHQGRLVAAAWLVHDGERPRALPVTDLAVPPAA